MKLSAICVAIVLAGVVGVAPAAGQHKVMPPITVSGAPVAQCTPPSSDPVCATFHRWIRANFTQREIRMLFGCETCSFGYLTGETYRVERRYHVKLHAYLVAQQATSGSEVASK